MQNHTLEVFYTIDADNVLVKTNRPESAAVSVHQITGCHSVW